MKKFALISLIHLFILVTTCLAAQAGVSIGLSSASLPVKTTISTVNALEQELTKAAGQPVGIRSFDNEGAIANWLLRFQEIDAAIVSASFIRQQPAGTLTHLVDLHLSGVKSPLAISVRQNLRPDLQEKIKEAFLSLQNSGARTAMGNLGIAGVTLPGKKLASKTIQPPRAKTVTAAPKKTVQTTTKPVAKPAPKPEPTPVKTTLEPAPQTTAPVVEKAPSKVSKVTPEKATEPKPTPAKPAPKPVAQVKEQPAPKVIEKAKPEAPKQAEKTQAPTPVVETKAIEREPKPVPKAKPAKETSTKKESREPAGKKRMIMFIVLLILLAVTTKVVLIALRWHSKRQSRESQQTHEVETVFVEESLPEPAPSEPVNENQPLVIEAGNLGPGKVPELLKRCADLPRPVVLKTTKSGNEKLVYFAGGQVAGALTSNSNDEPEVRWDKLGNLLVREKLITAEDKDRGMEFLAEEPDLRLGEALLKLGVIDLDSLRQALTKQAKVTIYSLILFPEGRYEVLDEASSLPPEESVSLEITSLIREASHHQSEWTAIRQTLPNLNQKLDFTENGQEKLENVSLAPQQEQTLALIDGNRTINDLCKESSMLDYEVYRFVYLMVKTGVLQ